MNNDFISQLAGNCSISPSSGVAMETNFTVTCKHWEDEDAPVTVEFSHIIKGEKTVFFFQNVANRGTARGTLWLPSGDEASGYYLNISIVVKDRFFAQFKENRKIKVENLMKICRKNESLSGFKRLRFSGCFPRWPMIFLQAYFSPKVTYLIRKLY